MGGRDPVPPPPPPPTLSLQPLLLQRPQGLQLLSPGVGVGEHWVRSALSSLGPAAARAGTLRLAGLLPAVRLGLLNRSSSRDSELRRQQSIHSPCSGRSSPTAIRVTFSLPPALLVCVVARVSSLGDPGMLSQCRRPTPGQEQGPRGHRQRGSWSCGGDGGLLILQWGQGAPDPVVGVVGAGGGLLVLRWGRGAPDPAVGTGAEGHRQRGSWSCTACK